MIGYSSNNSGPEIGPMNPKAMEAELIQKATQTAIVAARSILMSGGTEESALKTAKAAAESVLNPAGSDTETVSGRSSLGNAFGGKRRKAKRQAEVVASMALMSATSLQPTGSNMMGDCDSINRMYGRNIITVRQDEPSVLSGSTRPPRPATPSKSSASVGGFSFKGRTSQTKEARDPAEKSVKSARPPLPPASPQSMVSSFNNLLSGNDEDGESNLLDTKTLSHSSTMDSERDSSVESSLQGNSGSEDESEDDTTAFFFEKRKEKPSSSKSKAKRNSSWSLPDALISPIINPFTTALNLVHCGQGEINFGGEQRLEWKGKDRKRSSRRSGRSRARESSSIMESRDDTFDDETTAFSYKGKGTYRDPDFPNSYSYNSSHSEITELTEQELNVRSSIRETMENIVSKSKLGSGYRSSKSKSDKKKTSSSSKPSDEKKWKSYESPSNKVTSPSPKTKRSSGTALKTKKRSFFKRR